LRVERPLSRSLSHSRAKKRAISRAGDGLNRPLLSVIPNARRST
jgi:hypothetical protein